LAEQVKAVLRDFPELKLTEGRKVLEIRPAILWDKGRAVEFLLKSLGKCRTHGMAAYVPSLVVLPVAVAVAVVDLVTAARGKNLSGR